MEAHLRDDPDIALREQPVERGTEAVSILAPGLRSGKRAHAGPHDLTVRHHHFQAAVGVKVIPIHAVGVADTVVERVADDASPSRIGTVDPDLELAVLNVSIQIEVRHTRLDDGEVPLVIDLDDAVHALQIDDHRAREIAGRAAVSEVLAGRDRKQRNAIAVRDPDDPSTPVRRCPARPPPTRAVLRVRPRTASTHRDRARRPRPR